MIEGTLQAQSQEEVVAHLLQGGLVPVAIVITPGDLEGPARGAGRVHVRARERRMFTRQLTSLLRAKVELMPALRMLKDQAPSPGLRRLLDDLERQLQEGHALSEALARHPRVFGPLFLSAIRAGESAGKLDDILQRLVAFDEQQAQLESRLRGALAYPLLLLLLGLGCVALFVWLVVPRMAGLFAQLGERLPWPTQLLIDLSAWLTASWPWVLGTLAAGIVLGRWAWRTVAVVRLRQAALERLPMTRSLTQARQIGRFTRTLQLLLHSGLPVFQAMDAARPTLGSHRREARVAEAQEQIKRGESIARSLEAARCFPPIVTHLIGVGEASGTLVEVLEEIGGYYERLLDERLRMLTTLLEPGMILLMGLLVGFCVLAMVMPIFEMTQLAR